MRIRHSGIVEYQWAKSTVQNGVAEHVAREEMGRHSGYWWSPDGTSIACTQIDKAPLPLVHRPAYHADRTEVIEQHCPAAGEARAHVHMGAVEPDTGQTTGLDTGDEQWLSDSPSSGGQGTCPTCRQAYVRASCLVLCPALDNLPVR